MVLDIICVTPIIPATAKLPVIAYAIKNVAVDPVIRQVTVFTTLLAAVSFKSHTLSDFGSTY
jgi:hypothetical protein